MAFLQKAYDELKQQRGAVFAIHGTAGTGKSRLVEEFKTMLERERMQWLSGQAYSYCQKVPYFPLIDLLNSALSIEENDPPKKVRRKIELLIHNLVGDKDTVIPYIGRLYNLDYPEATRISPEAWKVRLQEAILEILTAYARRAPTIVCLEDLHWADPSSLELIRYLVSDFNYPVIFLCVFRPDLNLFFGQHIHALGNKYQEIRLQDLSLSETQDMLASLLKTDRVPPDLMRTIYAEVEGNPFYVEELVNSLIDSGILVYQDGCWRLQKELHELAIPLTIQGVIAGRFDRLDTQTKRVLQESAVIGRSFLYEILKKITKVRHRLDYCLSGLEHLDLIKLRSYEPDLEYLFKHAMTRDVVYKGLLKKERKTIHESIGRVIEQIYRERLPEFYETLAFHYRRGMSTDKAVRYLSRAGAKCVRRFALQEAHGYYGEAFERLLDIGEGNPNELIDLLNQWSFVYYYRGHYKEMLRLLLEYRTVADTLADDNIRGMYFAWLGCGLWHRERFDEARQYMLKALELGQAAGNQRLVGYACSWLTWIFTELGNMDEAVAHADRAQRICGQGTRFPYIYVNSMAGKGYACWHRGDRGKTEAAAKALLAYGESQADVRSKVMGHCCMGWGRLIAGRLDEAKACFQEAVSVSNAPWYSLFPKLALTYGCISMGQFQDAAKLIDEIIAFSREHGAEFAGTPAAFFQGVLMIAEGKIKRGIDLMENQLALWSDTGCHLRQTACGFILARVYAGMLQKKGLPGAAKMLSNIDFFLRHAPSLGKTANARFGTVIRMAEQIGADSVRGQAWLHWGLLHREKGRIEQARECLSKAIPILNRCGADNYAGQAQEALAELNR
jgi:tetratricopeptide (TPR) repeat protein